ncbi:hypothetical protein CRX58_00010 [Mycobacterium tuberculosis]|nr:hypothetical protein CRX58_00010 [Mycobacterium tuberculosis]
MGRDGEWTTTTGIAVSKDNGQTGGSSRAPSARPDRTAAEKPGSFREMRTSRWGRTSSPTTVTSTRSGPRPGEAVRHIWHEFRSALPDLTKYQYWNGDSNSWVPNKPDAATPVIPGRWAKCPSNTTPTSSNTCALHQRYERRGGKDRAAPQGPWSAEQMLVSSWQMPGGIYAPMMHPWSTGKDVYFNLSLWSAYNVMLMHTVLP